MYKKKTIFISMIALLLSVAILTAACTTDKPASDASEQDNTEYFGDDVIDLEDVEPDNTDVEDQTPDADDTTQLPDSTETTGKSDTTEATDATESTGGQQSATPAPGSLTFKEYLALSGDEQQAYALAFPSVPDFISWFNTAKEAYDNSDVVEITGPIDLEDYQ